MASAILGIGAAAATPAVTKTKQYMQEQFKKAFGEFDVEKVFWQTVYTEGIMATLSILWRFFNAIGAAFEFFELIRTPYSAAELADQLHRQRLFFFGRYCNNVFIPCTEEAFDEYLEARYPDLYEYKQGGGEETETPIGIVSSHLTTILVDWYPWIALSIPLFFVFLEYRRVKRFKGLT